MNVRDETRDPDPRFLLGVYLRDHLGGAMAGVALARRCLRANVGTELGDVLAGIEAEIIEDRRTLSEIMARLGVRESRIKEFIGLAAEAVARLKSNGRFFPPSPSSRVVELETLAAGVFTKRSLWMSLLAVVEDYRALDARELDGLAKRAERQYERLIIEHDRAATSAFGSIWSPQQSLSESTVSGENGRGIPRGIRI